jgi:predicted ArsR family transcriptional regulator
MTFEALNETDSKIVMWLAEVGGASTRQVAEQLNLSVRNAQLKLAALSKRDAIAEIGSGATDPRRRLCREPTAAGQVTPNRLGKPTT